MAQPRNRRMTPRGDHTGRLREIQAEEQASVLAEREGQLSMITHQQAAREENGVYDATNNQMIEYDGPELDEVEHTEDPSEPIDLTNNQAPREVYPDTYAMQEVVEAPVEVQHRHAIIRVVEDLEDVTIGHGNNYTFLAGRKYKVPEYVARHLEEKGLVYH